MAAIRMDGRAHADPYGPLLLPPYWIATQASSLWNATAFMMVLHALAAPAGALLVLRQDPAARVSAVVIGLALAVDFGLLDTATSGAEGYMAAVWAGLMVLLRGPWAWVAFAFAVGNHPLSLCCGPLLLSRRENISASAGWGFCVAVVAIAHQASGWGVPGVGGGGADAVSALKAYVDQGGGVAFVVLSGPLVGLRSLRTRRLALCTAVAFFLLFAVGEIGGYLRDHHIRILSIPAIACWASVNRWLTTAAVCSAVFLTPSGGPPTVNQQPGTVSLATIAGRTFSAIDGPIHIERVWFDGSPAIEPAALMLDAHLRKPEASTFKPDGRLVLIVSGLERTMGSIDLPGQILLRGPAFALVATDPGEARLWLGQHCGRGPRVGGAWDGYSALQPATRLEDLEPEWGCP